MSGNNQNDDDLKRRLRKHNDERLYLEADELMCEAADRIEQLEAERDELKAARGKWIDPNDKTQTRFLPDIGQAILFSHMGKTYIGKHTGGCFKATMPPFQIFSTWDCHWMLLPTATAKGEKR